MTRTLIALTATLVPFIADAAMLHPQLPTHLPPPRAAVSVTRPVDHRARAPTTRPRRPRRQTIAPDTIRVYDGDTFYVGTDAFRLRGIDAPEVGQPRAEAARQRLIALLRSGPVTIVRRVEDVYGRVVADVYVGGRNVAHILKAEGYAKPRASGRRRMRPVYRPLDISPRARRGTLADEVPDVARAGHDADRATRTIDACRLEVGAYRLDATLEGTEPRALNAILKQAGLKKEK